MMLFVLEQIENIVVRRENARKCSTFPTMFSKFKGHLKSGLCVKGSAGQNFSLVLKLES